MRSNIGQGKVLSKRTLMRNFVSFVAATLLIGSSLSAYAIEQGVVAPDFDLPGTGKAVKLSDYRGKLVYLDFWASWCAPCKRSFPWMKQLQTRFGGDHFQVIAVNLDEKRADADTFLAATPPNFLIGFDQHGDVAHSYAVKGMPSSVLIGADGKVVLMHAGFRDADKEELEGQISRILQHSGK